MKNIILSFIALTIASCGDSSNQQESPKVNSGDSIALTNTPETFKAVYDAAPSHDCSHDKTYIAIDDFAWRIVNGFSFASEDHVEISEDCTFRTYACGTLGYVIAGGESPMSGLVNIMVVGHLFPGEGCYEPGEHLCKYTVDGAGELRFECKALL